MDLPFLKKDTKRSEAKSKKIQEFVAQVKTGALSRTNRYAVIFTPPAGVDPSNLQKILLFCDQVQLPGTNFSTVQNRTFGEFREVPYEKLYDNVQMSFYVDNDMKVKELFDNWTNKIQDPETRTFNYYDTYISNMTIEIQDLNDNTRYEMTLFECYPKTISSIQLDSASKDVMKLTVTMQYKYWTASTVKVLASGEKIPEGMIDKFTKNFANFQKQINDVLGPSIGNAVTGIPLTYGVTKLPGLLKF